MTKEEIAKLEAELERLRTMVYVDELTGILNRRGFLEETNKEFRAVTLGRTEVERRVGIQIPFSIVFLDLDNFKQINDEHGHAAGDEALKTAAQVLRTTLRLGDVYGRWGGEEFVVALLGADSDVAFAVAEKLRRALETADLSVDGKKISLTASFGVSDYHGEQSLEELIENADKAMYQAKQNGKNRLSLFTHAE